MVLDGPCHAGLSSVRSHMDPITIPSWPPLSDTSNNHTTIQSIETSSRIAKFRDWPSECCGIAGPKTSASRYKTVFSRINHDVWPLSSSKGRCLLHHEERTPTDSFDRRHCWNSRLPTDSFDRRHCWNSRLPTDSFDRRHCWNSRLPLCVWRSGFFYEDMHRCV